MRNFIISDIHGNDNLYYSVMFYLENISKHEDITLYINGDLIDRGFESGEILLDVITRINNKSKSFNIIYLAGNHELMMYQLYQDRIKGKNTYFNDWYLNGGDITDDYLIDTLKDKDKILEVVDFISNLRLHHKFTETIDNKNIVLVHAACPLEVSDTCNLKIKDNNELVEYLVWTREYDPFIPFRCRIGNNKYFSIVGHTPNDNQFGYTYNKNENYLNIDGGSAYYVSGMFEYNHYPLVEIKEGYLKILTFNNNNEIIHGTYFKDYKSVPFNEEELNEERKYLNKDLKIKRLVKLSDNIIDYKGLEQ